jgi:exonuclease SbcD
MIRFVHVADIHFGVENYGKIDPKTGIHTRLLDFKQALDHCIDYAIAQQVDFFLFAGDAYKTHHPTQTQQKLLMNCFLRLYNAHIPIIIIVGNHDHPLSFGKANALDIFGDLPLDSFYLFAKPRMLLLKTRNGPIQIVGIPWPTRHTVSLNNIYLGTTDIADYISNGVARIISDMAQKLDPTIPAVLASHITVSSGLFSGSEKRAIYGKDPILFPSHLAIVPFDYVALGHLHRYQDLNRNGYPSIVYAGSIERIDFGERHEEKGFCDVIIHKKGDVSHTFVPVPTRPFVQIEVVISPEGHQTPQLLDAIKKHVIKDVIVKIIYHLPDEVPDRVDLKAIQRACADAMHIAGILPIFKASQRTRRFVGTEHTMDMASLLHSFFASRPESKDRAALLTEKALALCAEITQEGTEDVSEKHEILSN